jgi:hypothetical protein
MKIRTSVLSVTVLIVVRAFSAATLTPADLNPNGPFGVQPDVGLTVTSGVTQPFFSDLSGLMFPGPGIVDILANIQAFDSGGNPITNFQLTGVTVMQGSSTFSPPLEMFSLSSPMTLTSSVNPLDQVTIDPSNLNLAFTFNSDASFQYSSTFDVSGVPTGGFITYGSVEPPLIPEPNLFLPSALAMATVICWSFRRGHRTA